MYTARKAVLQIEEHGNRDDKPLLKHFKADLKKIAVLSKDFNKLHLLLAVVEKEEFTHEAMFKTLDGKVFQHLTHFTTFIKTHLQKAVVFVIDGIDENRYFFHKHAVNKESLKLFYYSSVSQEIHSSLMAQNFYLSLFYPEIDGINIEDNISRPDKFPTYTIKWDTPSLINYADHLLINMNKTATTIRCKELPGFETLVNYVDEKNRAVIDQISTPRELHYFMIALILEMNNHAKNAKMPFIATFDNVNHAFQAARKQFDKFKK